MCFPMASKWEKKISAFECMGMNDKTYVHASILIDESSFIIFKVVNITAARNGRFPQHLALVSRNLSNMSGEWGHRRCTRIFGPGKASEDGLCKSYSVFFSLPYSEAVAWGAIHQFMPEVMA
jgi:hypothetical protein